MLGACPHSNANYLRSLSGGSSTYVTFINTLDSAASVYWIDFDGRRALYRTLPPGESYRQQTYVHHPWVVCAGAPQSPVAVFHPSPTEAGALICSPMGAGVASSALQPCHPSNADALRSLSGGPSTHITFANTLSTAVNVYWIDYEGNRVFYETLPAGDSYRQQTYVYHPWVVCSGPQQSPVAVFHPSAEATASIDDVVSG